MIIPDVYGIEFVNLSSHFEGVSGDLSQEVKDYWEGVHEARRNITGEGEFEMNTHRLAMHDAFNYLNVISRRVADRGKSPLGYKSWWLTVDAAAHRAYGKLSVESQREIGSSPVIAVDFLLKYLVFGPNRDRVDISTESQMSPALSAMMAQAIPPDLLQAAAKVREQYAGLPERAVRLRMRDALDREKMRIGPVHLAGLDGVDEAVAATF